MQVLDGASASEIEDVLAYAAIACARSLSARDVSEGVFDGCALAEGSAAVTCGLEGTQVEEHALVGVNGDGATVAESRACTSLA